MRVAHRTLPSVAAGTPSATIRDVAPGQATVVADGFPPVGRLSRAFGTLLRTVFSFEALFALFLYSNNLKILLPTLPIDETVLLFALSLPLFITLLWRHGLPLHGLTVITFALLFFGWMTIGLLWTPSRAEAVRVVAYNLVFNLYALSVACLVVAARRERLRRFLLWVTIIGLFLAGNGLWIWITTNSFRFYRDFAEHRIYLAWGYPAATAAAVVLAASLSVPYLRFRQLATLLLLSMLSLFLLISTARGPLLALVASVLVPLVAFAPSIRHGRLAISRIQLFTIIFILGGALYVVHLIATAQLANTLGRLAAAYDEITGHGAFQRFSRLNYWQYALHFWADSPWFGHGPASFSILYSGREEPGTHPHNILLEIAVDYGLLGIVLFSMFVVSAIRGIRAERIRRDRDYLCVWMVFAGMVVGAMVSVDLAAQGSLFASIGLLTLPGADAFSGDGRGRLRG